MMRGSDRRTRRSLTAHRVKPIPALWSWRKAALQPLSQFPAVLPCPPARHPYGHWQQQPADAVAGEADADGDIRVLTVVPWVNPDIDGGPQQTVDATQDPAPRRADRAYHQRCRPA